MLSGVGVFGMELILNKINIDGSAKGIEYYLFGIACYGFIACSVSFFFPYRDNQDIKGMETLMEEPVVEPYIPTPETGRKVFDDDAGNLNRSAEPS